MLHVPLEKYLGLFTVGRRGEGHGPKHTRANFLGQGLDRAALAGGVASFKQDDDPQTFGSYPSLEMAKLDLEFAQLLLIGFALHLGSPIVFFGHYSLLR